MVWNAPLRDRWVALKEIWYDRTTLLPRLVLLYDDNGRIVLRATLADHQPVKIDGMPNQQWPKVATSYDLQLPESGSRLKFNLKRALALKTEVRGVTVPNERSFGVPEEPDASEIIDLDARSTP
jgi:hypothetical protein